MPTLIKYKNALIVVVVVCLLYLGYVYFWPSDADISLLEGVSETTQNPVNTELLTLLGRTKQIKLDSSLFEDAVFQSLQDFGQIIPPQPVGRENPFAPLPGTPAAK